jgi:REP element-mobilizing transposase RayT
MTDKSFSAYFDHISILINIDKKVDTMIPSLVEYEKKEEKRTIKDMGNQYFVKYYFWTFSWYYYVFCDEIKKPAYAGFIFY